MPTIQIRELPQQSFACRRLPSAEDLDLCLAEAAALQLWATTQDCIATAETWLLLSPDSASVAVPVRPDAPAEDGIELRPAPASSWRVAACAPTRASARECADKLAAWPVSDHGRPLADDTLWLRLNPKRNPAGATLHLPLGR